MHCTVYCIFILSLCTCIPPMRMTLAFNSTTCLIFVNLGCNLFIYQSFDVHSCVTFWNEIYKDCWYSLLCIAVWIETNHFNISFKRNWSQWQHYR